MKTICAMQPYVFPHLPYYQLAHAVDEFWVLDDVQFARRGWMNRNYLILDGKRHRFTFPVTRGKRADMVFDKTLPATFSQSLNQVAATINHAYGKAPQARSVVSIFDALMSRRWNRFLDFSLESLRLSLSALGIRTPLHLTSSMALPPELKSQERILAICGEASANRYINPIGGRSLYDALAFEARGVQLSYLRGAQRSLQESGATTFQSEISIIHLIANLAPPHSDEWLRNYALIDA